jgi:hypothetical protein
MPEAWKQGKLASREPRAHKEQSCRNPNTRVRTDPAFSIKSLSFMRQSLVPLPVHAHAKSRRNRVSIGILFDIYFAACLAPAGVRTCTIDVSKSSKRTRILPHGMPRSSVDSAPAADLRSRRSTTYPETINVPGRVLRPHRDPGGLRLYGTGTFSALRRNTADGGTDGRQR